MVFCNKALNARNIPFKYCHNPYFNRWFSAIEFIDRIMQGQTGHNPYFNRWFSAISQSFIKKISLKHVTILILIDGFLQCSNCLKVAYSYTRHNPYFNRWFSAIILNI